MVDYHLFETILSHKEEGYIEYGDFIDNKTLILFSKSRVDKVKLLFCKKKVGDSPFYSVELLCPKCGNSHIKELSRNELYKVVSDIRTNANKKQLCKKCSIDVLNKQTICTKELELKQTLDIQNNTKTYIDIFLNPEISWKKGVSNYAKIRDLNLIVDKEIIYDYINDMSYYDFLETPYWKAISEKVKIKANYRCQLCNSNIGLNTHHRCYDNHGDELHHMEDLICICEECHNNHHNK